jgi:hypothetical protein
MRTWVTLLEVGCLWKVESGEDNEQGTVIIEQLILSGFGV